MSHQESHAPPSDTTPPASTPDRDWQAIADHEEFKDLVRLKRLFIIPATVFFIAHYFALPILVGYFPRLMETQVVGKINLAYIFALMQFFIAWIVMAAYVWRAKVFDLLCGHVIDRILAGDRSANAKAPKGGFK
ncbi:MAG TPA: DUF485 domain-containing protein [Phycisphaerales bacterium]|nr:DUF485 domain-containing protein [Phycisphaerales bacterium]